MSTPPPLRLLDAPEGPRGAPIPAPAIADEPAPEAAVLCRACRHPVTSARHRIEVQNAHAHRFMNPAGNLFQIACFAQAPGCQVLGPPSHEYPWFAGYAWRFAHCARCGDHLGWHFQNEAGGFFFGLRLDRIAYFSVSSPDP